MQRNMIFGQKLFFANCFSVYAFLLLITFLMLISCKKEKKNEEPVITVSQPNFNLTLSAIDSVFISATITDDNGPLVVSVYIANEQMSAVTTSWVKNSSDNSITLGEYYYFSNKYLESGTYYVVIHAEDGVNSTNKFVEVTISGIPRVLKSVYIGVKNTSGIKIFCGDSLGTYSQVGILPINNVLDFEINNYSEQLYLLDNSGCLSCYTLPDLQLEWQKTGLSLVGNTYNGQLMEYDKLIFVTDAKGYLKGIDNTGTVRKAYFVNLGSPEKFNFFDLKSMVYVFNYNNQDKYIQTLSSSGSVLNTYMVNFTPKVFFNHSLNHVMIIGAGQGEIVMNTFNSEISYLYPFGNPLAGSYCDAVETPDDQYLISTSSNMWIVEKTYGNNTIYAPGHKADKMNFESLSQTLYATDSNNLSVFHYPNSQIIFTYNFPAKVLFFDFYYNK